MQALPSPIFTIRQLKSSYENSRAAAAMLKICHNFFMYLAYCNQMSSLYIQPSQTPPMISK